MPMRFRLSWPEAACWLLIALLLPGNAPAQGSATLSTEFPGLKIREISKDIETGGLRLLKLANHYGDIRIKRGNENKLRLIASAQSMSGSMPQLVDEGDSSYRALSIVYPQDREPASVFDGRVDIVLRIPAGISLEIDIERGNLYALSRLDNPLTARSETASYTIYNTAASQLWTRLGQIHFRHAMPPDLRVLEHEIRNSTGNIHLQLDYATDFRFEASGGGEVLSNSAVMLESMKQEGALNIIHSGTSRQLFRLHSDTGNIQLQIGRHREKRTP